VGLSPGVILPYESKLQRELQNRVLLPRSDSYSMENSLGVADPSHSIKILLATCTKG